MKKALLALALAAVIVSGCVSRTTHTANPDPQQVLVERAAEVVRDMRSSAEFPDLAEHLAKARGVLIMPRYYKAGWFISVAGGQGVLLARDQFDEWSSPAFYAFGTGGFGVQAGVQSGRMIFCFMEREALEQWLETGFTFDTDFTVVALTSHMQHEASNLTDRKPVVAFVDLDGLYAGVSFDGGSLSVDEQANRTYYGDAAATPEAIVLRRDHLNPGSQVLSLALDARTSEPK